MVGADDTGRREAASSDRHNNRGSAKYCRSIFILSLAYVWNLVSNLEQEFEVRTCSFLTDASR